MKVYVLQNKEQLIDNMSEAEILNFCKEHDVVAFAFHCTFVWNDWNWIRQYPDTLHIIANSLEEAREFILKAYYHSEEFDGESGVIFRHIMPLCAMQPV